VVETYYSSLIQKLPNLCLHAVHNYFQYSIRHSAICFLINFIQQLIENYCTLYITHTKKMYIIVQLNISQYPNILT
jgi:hypothetical protein